MKDYRIILCGLTLLVTIFLVGGASASTYSVSFLLDDISTQDLNNIPEGSVSEITASCPANISANNLVQTIYDRQEMLNVLGISKTGAIENRNCSPRSLAAINSYYPVECIRQVSDSLVYVVYHIKDANTGEIYNMYLFFEKLVRDDAIKDGMEVWWLTGTPLFSCTELTYHDFSEISIGSSISEVAEVDPMTDMFIPPEPVPIEVESFDFKLNEYITYTETPDAVMEYQEYHLLTDGILCIMYSRNSPDEEFAVSSIGYNPNFEVASNYTRGTIQLAVAPIDYSVAEMVPTQE